MEVPRSKKNSRPGDFTAASHGQNRVPDITYVNTNLGWICLTVALGLFEHKIIGQSMNRKMEAGSKLAAAFKMAVRNRPVNPGKLIFHSDRGVRYA